MFNAHQRRTFILFLLFGLLMNACGSMGGTPIHSNFDPCTLLNANEIETALGRKVHDQKSNEVLVSNGSRVTDCKTSVNDPSYPEIDEKLTLIVAQYPTVNDCVMFFEQDKQRFKSQDGYRSISGIGDDAFQTPTSLIFRYKNVCIDMSMVSIRGSDSYDRHEQLAKLVVAHLPSQ